MTTKFLFLFSLLLFSVLSQRALREENYDEDDNIENKDSQEEETCEKQSQEETDFSKVPSSKILKENMPKSEVLLPIRRSGSSNMQIGVGPCGGIEKKSANTLTTKGSSINFIWKILVPENSGNCTVKISNGRQDEESFQLLKPVNEEVNKDGSFICGREKGFENKEFILPEDYECDGCTLQWKWSTSYGDIYSCSDIIINGEKLEKCIGKCLNGGSCFNGNCLCLENYSGEFCENEKGQSSLTWLWILLGLICAGGVGFGIYKYWDNIKNIFKTTQSWITDKNQAPKIPFPEQKSKENQIDSNGFEENSKYP
jgi:hypothetical protein